MTSHLHTYLNAPRRTDRPVIIYALQDPRDNTIKYIGQAVDVEKRLAAHLNNAKNWGNYSGATLAEKWVFSLFREGLEPRLIILAQVPFIDAGDVEKEFIQLFSTYSVLTNINHSGVHFKALA